MPGYRKGGIARQQSQKRTWSIQHTMVKAAATSASMSAQGKEVSHEAETPRTPPEHAALLVAINGCKMALTEKIDIVYIELGRIRRDIDAFSGRVTEVEHRVSAAEDVHREHATDLHSLNIRVKHLESRAEDAENRNRRNNLRIIGLPEGAEGKDTTLFTEQLLQSLLPRATFSPQFVVERAHRIPIVRGPQGAPPPTFIYIYIAELPRSRPYPEGGQKCLRMLSSSYFRTIPLKHSIRENHLTMSAPVFAPNT